MATCPITTGITKGCLDAKGGIETMYLFPIEQLNTFVPGTSGDVNSMTLTTGNKMYEIQFEKQQGSFTQTASLNPANGTWAVKQTLTVPVNRTSYTKDYLIKILSYNKLGIVVKNNNGEYKFMGRTGAYLITTAAESGTALIDKEGYTLTFEADEPEWAYTLSASQVSTLLVPA